ncbi:MAG: GNAT family N-acetyltransferase [Thermodesulfobacteriota bacterium]
MMTGIGRPFLGGGPTRSGGGWEVALDMLVRLYDLGDPAPLLEKLAGQGIGIRRALAREEASLVSWVGRVFSSGWASECRISMSRIPPTCYVASREELFLGFSCFETAYRGFLGPMGVLESERGKGIGTALLLCSLRDMAHLGYRYAIIGEVGPTAFYEKAVGAMSIAGSEKRPLHWI